MVTEPHDLPADAGGLAATASAAAAGPRVTVTPMRRRHVRAAMRIDRQVYAHTWSMNLYLSEIGRDDRCYLVARDAARVVGHGGIMRMGSDAHISTVAVDLGSQGSGIATRLIAWLLRWARAGGTRQATLEVRMSNTRARTLYQRFGFAPAGVRRGYYTDQPEDALVMWADDITSPAYGQRLDQLLAAVPGTTQLDPTFAGSLEADPGRRSQGSLASTTRHQDPAGDRR